MNFLQFQNPFVDLNECMLADSLGKEPPEENTMNKVVRHKIQENAEFSERNRLATR